MLTRALAKSVRLSLPRRPYLYNGELSGPKSPPAFSFRGISVTHSCLSRLSRTLGPARFRITEAYLSSRERFEPHHVGSLGQLFKSSIGYWPCWLHVCLAYVIAEVFYGGSLRYFPHGSWPNPLMLSTLFIVKSRQPILDSHATHVFPRHLIDMLGKKFDYLTVILERRDMCMIRWCTYAWWWYVQKFNFMKMFKIWV